MEKQEMKKKLDEVNIKLRQSEITYSQLKGQKILLEEMLSEGDPTLEPKKQN